MKSSLKLVILALKREVRGGLSYCCMSAAFSTGSVALEGLMIGIEGEAVIVVVVVKAEREEVVMRGLLVSWKDVDRGG